jgi:hypothetical protein
VPIRVESGFRLRFGPCCVLLGVGLSACAPAWSAVSNYQCGAKQELVGQFTPREVRVTLKTLAPESSQQWTLLRLREAGQARYKQPGGEVMLTILRSQAELVLAKGAEPLVCKLKLGEFGSRPAGR